MIEHCVVIGDGGMGTICAILLEENGHRVRLWSAFEDQAEALIAHRENRRFLPGRPLAKSIEITPDDARAFADVTLIVSAVPTVHLRSVWQRLAQHCPPDVPICSITKGIENETLLRPTEVIREVLGEPDRPVAVLSGPCIAPEVARGLPASVTLAAERADLADRCQHAFNRPYFRCYASTDIVGVELAGATKNVIAIAAGVVDGLEYGDNAKAALLSRGLAEIARLGAAAGAQEETFFGLAGVGDLVTTCISPHGRNRTFGQKVGQGGKPQEILDASDSVVEGVNTTRSLVALADQLGVDMPIAAATAEVLFDGKDPRDAIAELMTRPLKSE